MGAVLIVAALSAQAATASGSTVPTSTDASAPQIHTGATSYVDLEGGVGYSSNPQLSVVNDEGSAFGRVSIHAVHSRVSARSTTVLSGYAEDVSYTNHHGSQQSVSLYGRHDTAVSEHVRLFGDVNASYQEGGQLDTRILGIPFVPPLPGGTVTPPILIPPSGDFLSVTGREYSLGAHGGGTFALGQHDSLSISSGVDHVVFHSAFSNSNYTTIPVSLAYDRVLNARTTVGARVVAQDTEYNGPANFRVITPQLTGRLLLAERLTFSGAIGVSFARVDDGLTVRHTTGLAAEANLCGQGETSFFCARVAADEETATTAGPARTISGGVDFTQRLDADQSIQFSLGATHYSTPTSVIVGRNFSSANYYHAATGYTRRLGTRLFGGVNLAARKLTQNGPDPKTDLNASLFIRYRFGDVQ
jgi:hypothetical protein